MLAIYGGLIAFCTYSCMYAFRKGFAVGAYDFEIFGMQAKVVFVVSQLVGYTISKFYGIRFISGLDPKHRVKLIIGLNLLAWLALLLFGLVSGPWQALAMLATGLPLGLIWGLLFSFLEGRRTTELMGAFLCVSFIFSSGFVKTVAKYVNLNWAVAEVWVPFVTGAVFVLPLIFFTWLLGRMPPPDEQDQLQRAERKPMNKEQRRTFMKKYYPGILLLLVVYVMLTILRDLRDNFMADVWRENQVDDLPALFTKTEVPASLIILTLIGLMFLIKNNKAAFSVSLGMVMVGLMIASGSTWMFQQGSITVVHWMTAIGLGLYMGYIPFNTMLYERLIAILREPVNIGFLMYISDALGYLGSMALLVSNEWIGLEATNWTSFLSNSVMLAGVIGMIFTLFSWVFFKKKNKQYA
jgi:MFS family permease